jgi:hypothetical protein
LAVYGLAALPPEVRMGTASGDPSAQAAEPRLLELPLDLPDVS